MRERNDRQMLNIALPKGRLGDEVFALLEKAGYNSALKAKGSRKLVLEDKEGGFRYFLVKPSDVAIYVLHGAADVGVVGKDILLETRPDVYELMDLRLGACKIAVAGPKNFKEPAGKLRVATKFPNIALRYYGGKSREIELIALNGSIELAPIVGLSDVIVDIVQTGGTLKANNLAVLEDIMPISARLIANIASYKFKASPIDAMTAAFQRELDTGERMENQ